MKKTILSLGLVVAGATSVFAQGVVAVYSTSSSYSIYTNTTTYTSALAGNYNTTGGKTVTTANQYYYALLVQPYSAGITTANPLDSNYQLSAYATNYVVAGGIRGEGAAAGGPAADWAAPTSSTYNSGTEDTFILVGWTASEGSSWLTVSNELATGNWTSTTGSFGVSAVGYGYSGGGPNTLTAPDVFGVSTGMPGGLSGGLTLYAVPTPEPSTIALAGLGVSALVAFRRRNSSK